MGDSETVVTSEAAVRGGDFSAQGTSLTLPGQGGSDDTGVITVANFFDPNPNDVSGDYEATIDWGDGITTTGEVDESTDDVFGVSGEHVYADGDGTTQNVQVTITNGDGLAHTVLSTIGFIAPAAATGFQVTGLTFGGAGQIALSKSTAANVTYMPGNMKLGDVGTMPIGPQVYSASPAGTVQLNDPVAYVGGSLPTIQVAVTVQGTLPAGTVVKLYALSNPDSNSGVMSILTTSDQETATGAANETLTFQVSLSQKLAAAIQNTTLGLNWKVVVGANGQPIAAGSTPTRLFTTLAQPQGDAVGPAGLSARRLDFITGIKDLSVNDTLDKAVEHIADRLEDHSHFNLDFNGLGDDPALPNPWVPFDNKNGEDCVSLCTLTKQALDMVGVNPAQTALMFVYSRTKSWDQLSNADTKNPTVVAQGLSSANLDNGFTTKADGTELHFWSGGWNRWEGCLVYTTAAGTQQWYMGGGSMSQNPKPDDYEVLYRWTGPNPIVPRVLDIRTRRVDQHQAWYDGAQPNMQGVKYPFTPEVTNMTAAAAQAAFEAAGYHNIKFQDIPITDARLIGRVAGFTSVNIKGINDTRSPGAPTDPHSTITIKLYVRK